MRRCSGKANKLRYINTIRETQRDIAIKEWKINNIKKKSSRLSYIFVETVSLRIDKFQSEKAASVSEALALLC